MALPKACDFPKKIKFQFRVLSQGGSTESAYSCRWKRPERQCRPQGEATPSMPVAAQTSLYPLDDTTFILHKRKVGLGPMYPVRQMYSAYSLQTSVKDNYRESQSSTPLQHEICTNQSRRWQLTSSLGIFKEVVVINLLGIHAYQ